MRDTAERAENLRRLRLGDGNLMKAWLTPDGSDTE
jgi:hypothetical protein